MILPAMLAEKQEEAGWKPALQTANPAEIDALRTVIQWHRKRTHSWRAAQLLAEWSRMHRLFWRVSPYGSTCSAADFVASHTPAEEFIYPALMAERIR